MHLNSIKHGIYGGLVGGVVFGGLMAMMGMLPMIGKMVGIPTATAGFFAHMGISAVIGGSFPVLLGWITPTGQGGLGTGSLYGLVW